MTAPKKKVAALVTEYRKWSHADVVVGKILEGYHHDGKAGPNLQVVSMYVDQFPRNDWSKGLAKKHGFTIHDTIAGAVTCGGKTLAVDGVLSIGEHGRYPVNDRGQTLYPRRRFFEETCKVFERAKKAVPFFNDKHLAATWTDAKWMYDRARELFVPLMAGSSLPVTWRMPSIDLPHGAEVEEVMCVAFGRVDSYDFHALEVIGCMAERRQGGETSVAALQALRGDAVWKALKAGTWAAGGWDPALFEACLCRSQTLAQPPTASHRYPTPAQMRAWVREPVAYRFEYSDGLKATMLLLNGLVGDFTFAARLKGRAEPLSTLFYLPPGPNIVYSAALMSKVEALFLTAKPAYPIERTLLTTGLVAAGMQSLAAGQKRLETPHLAVRYKVTRPSTFWQS
jgi:hypothetical protein